MAKISLSNITLGKDLLAKNSHVTIGLTNPKTPTNVLAGLCVRLGVIVLTKYFILGHRYTHAAKFTGSKNNTNTQKLSEKIPLIAIDDFLKLRRSTNEQQLGELPESTKIICVDLVEGATPLPLFHASGASFIYFWTRRWHHRSKCD